MSVTLKSNDSGFDSFEQARQALILKYYHDQPDFQTRIPNPRNNDNECCQQTDPNYVSTLAEKSMVYPKMKNRLDFAREYILLLAQWNQKDLFEKDKIRDFVNYIEARKGSFVVPVWDAQAYNSNVTLLSQDVNTTTQPWSRGNAPFVRELTNHYFSADGDLP